MLLNKSIRMLTAFSLSLGAMSPALAQTQKVERPPQFVLLAFDGSMNLEFWKESRGFATKTRNEGKAVDWTYFISGVYWLHEKNYPLYMPPHIESNFPSGIDREAEVQRRLREANDPNVPGKVKNSARGKYSDIGFGNNVPDVTERIKQINMAFEEGHEVASHANGHYAAGSGGRKWTVNQWNSEFKQFNDLIFNAYENNGIPNNSKYASGYAFGPEDVVGFRAPTLSASPDMFQALAESKFKYDTSGKNSGAESATRWPSRNKHGTWMLPLGYIKIAGTQKETASMDYNFFVMQSHGQEDKNKENQQKYREQMLQSYVKYFNDNYYGNRAPVHIGHHFSKWNGGAYWEAMKQLTTQVCGMKEVRCVTYIEYVQWLDAQSDSQLKAYSTGSFQQVARPASLKALEVVGDSKALLSFDRGNFKATATMDRRSKLLGYRLGLKVNNKLEAKNEIALSDLRLRIDLGEQAVVSAVVLNKAGDEIHSYTLKIEHLGQASEEVATTSLEERAMMGDLPEAHAHGEHE